MANADHVIGALVLTVVSLAAAEVARPLRFLLVPLGVALLITPFAFGVDTPALIASVLSGLVLIACCVRRGPIRNRYGNWSRLIV